MAPDHDTSCEEDLVISRFDPRGVQILVLNRPQHANALNSPLLRCLESGLESVRTDPNVRAVMITGNGRNAFSIGADLEELLEFGHSEAMAFLELGHRVMSKIERLEKPTVAAINGNALGGGLELALACSFRVCAEGSIFGLPEVTLGLIPGFGGTQRLPRIIARGRAHEMILTGKTYAASEALQTGLVTGVTPQDELLQVSLKLLERTICHPIDAVAAALTALGGRDEEGFEEALARERQLCCRQISSIEAKQKIARFIRKRAIARLTVT